MGGVQEEKTGQFVNLARLLSRLLNFLLNFVNPLVRPCVNRTSVSSIV